MSGDIGFDINKAATVIEDETLERAKVAFDTAKRDGNVKGGKGDKVWDKVRVVIACLFTCELA